MKNYYCIAIILIIFLLILTNLHYRNEQFIEKFKGAALDYKMSTCSNFNLLKDSSKWRKSPNNLDLKCPDDMPTSKSDPTLDGTNKHNNSKFTLACNQCKPECCPSTYSCDRGCICTNEQQRKFINQRGFNRTLPDDDL